jgi:hypothetical protein
MEIMAADGYFAQQLSNRQFVTELFNIKSSGLSEYTFGLFFSSRHPVSPKTTADPAVSENVQPFTVIL